MCKIEVLNQNKFASILRCSSCNDLHIGYGTVIQVLEIEEFRQFTRIIDELYENHYDDLLLNGERLFIRTDSTRIILAFNKDELKALWEILQETLVLIELESILKV
jgi:predicted lipase